MNQGKKGYSANDIGGNSMIYHSQGNRGCINETFKAPVKREGESINQGRLVPASQRKGGDY